jgi:hypothetical protein
MADTPKTPPATPTMRPADPAMEPNLPPLYRRVRPIDPARHVEWGVADKYRYEFAGKARAIPITGAEFPVAAREYPIVFITKPNPTAAILVGLRQDENLFVDAAGNWRSGAYLPAYLRRYPFLMAQSPDGQRLILCVDEASDLLARDAPMRFFVDGKRSPYLDRMLQMGADIHRDQLRTGQIVMLLDRLGLLIDRRVEAALPSGEKIGFQGFGLVDEAKLNALPDDQFLELRRSGGLGLVYLHLVSFANLRTLATIAAERTPSAD